MVTQSATPAQSTIHNPQSPIACAAPAKDGSPCRGRPADGSLYCPFHDPARADAIARGRSQGGATPRRRYRRYPRLLTASYLAELLSEIFISAANKADLANPRCVSSLASFARILTPTVHYLNSGSITTANSRPELAPDTPHLLRLLPEIDPDILALLEAKAAAAPPPAEADPPPQPPIEPAPSEVLNNCWQALAQVRSNETLLRQSLRAAEPNPSRSRPTDHASSTTAPCSTGQGRGARPEEGSALSPAPMQDCRGADLQSACPSTERIGSQTKEQPQPQQQAEEQPQQQAEEQPQEQVEEQAVNRLSTGAPATETNECKPLPPGFQSPSLPAEPQLVAPPPLPTLAGAPPDWEARLRTHPATCAEAEWLIRLLHQGGTAEARRKRKTRGADAGPGP